MATKFKILEIIIKNRNENFDAIRLALMREFPEMSWEIICSFIALLGQENYLKNLYAENELQDILVQPTAFARLYEMKETVKDETVKNIISRIIQLASGLL